MKKSLTGFHVKFVAVVALVAQDDKQGGEATIASTFSMFDVGAQAFDEGAYDLSHIDLFIADECSMASVEQGQNITQYLDRGPICEVEVPTWHWKHGSPVILVGEERRGSAHPIRGLVPILSLSAT